jgi:CRISPR-associated exonuclease Cas4
MAIWLLVIALVLGGVAVWLLVRSRVSRLRAGLPSGRIIYADTGAWDRCERPLFSNRYRLTGKPDYLVRAAKGLVPVEVKSSGAPVQPYPAHVLQLAAYCLLVEEREGRPPPYGIIQYRDRTFEVDYTPALRAQVLQALDALRMDRRAREVVRSHQDPERCRRCGFRGRCGQRLS